MVRISKRYLKEEILMKIYRLFFEIMSRSHTQNDFANIISDLFSPTEKIMIAKRVAVIYLLIKGVEQKSIAEVLKVSTGTVSKYAVLFYNKESKIIQMIKKMQQKEKVLDFLEDTFADLFIQPGIKAGHWNLYWQNKRRKEQKKSTGL